MTLDDLVADIAKTVKESVQEAVKSVSVKYDARIKELQEKIDAIPHPEKGEKGDSVSIDEVKALVVDAVSDIEIPVPKDGEDGLSPSADEVAKSMEGIFSKWALDFERKADVVLSKAIDEIPKPKDGRDALDLEDFDLVLGEDNRTITMSLKRGETVLEKSVKLAVPIHVGVYRDGHEYQKGDNVTFAGSTWISLKDAPEGKPSSSEDWMLIVKRGRDGRESVKIEKPPSKVKVD